MPKNTSKARCAVAGCNAWAMRGSRLCAAHSGTAHGGAPAGNTNRLKHGLYSHHYTDEELAILLSPPDDLTDEIALCRVLAGRLMRSSTNTSVVSGSALIGRYTSKLSMSANRMSRRTSAGFSSMERRRQAAPVAASSTVYPASRQARRVLQLAEFDVYDQYVLAWIHCRLPHSVAWGAL